MTVKNAVKCLQRTGENDCGEMRRCLWCRHVVMKRFVGGISQLPDNILGADKYAPYKLYADGTKFFISEYIQSPTPLAWGVLLVLCSIKSHTPFGVRKVFDYYFGRYGNIPYGKQSKSKKIHQKSYEKRKVLQ